MCDVGPACCMVICYKKHSCLRSIDGRKGINLPCKFGLALGLVDRRVGGCVDDDVRLHRVHRLRQPLQVGEVATQVVRVVGGIAV